MPYKIGYYDVKKPTNVFLVAKQLRADAATIVRLNKLRNTQQDLVVGQRIKIPVYPKGHKYDPTKYHYSSEDNSKKFVSKMDSVLAANALTEKRKGNYWDTAHAELDSSLLLEDKKHNEEQAKKEKETKSKTVEENLRKEREVVMIPEKVQEEKVKPVAETKTETSEKKKEQPEVKQEVQVTETKSETAEKIYETKNIPDENVYDPDDDKTNIQLIEARMALNQTLLDGVKASLDTLHIDDNAMVNSNDIQAILKKMKRARERKELAPYLERMRDSLTLANSNLRVQREATEQRLNSYLAYEKTKNDSTLNQLQTVVTESKTKNKKNRKEIQQKIVLNDTIPPQANAGTKKRKREKEIQKADSVMEWSNHPVETEIKKGVAEEHKQTETVSEIVAMVEDTSLKKEIVVDEITEKKKGFYWDTAHAEMDSSLLIAEKKKEEKMPEKKKTEVKKQVIPVDTLVVKNNGSYWDTAHAEFDSSLLYSSVKKEEKKNETKKTEVQQKPEIKKQETKIEAEVIKKDTVRIQPKGSHWDTAHAEFDEQELASNIKKEEEIKKTEKTPLNKKDSVANSIHNIVFKDEDKVAAKDTVTKNTSGETKSITTLSIERKNAPADNMANADTIRKIKSEFFLKRAQNAIAEKKMKLANEYLMKSVELWNSNYDAWMALGDMEAQFGSGSKALTNYQQCARIDSTQPKLFFKLAEVYLKLKRRSEAVTYYSKAIYLDKEYIEAYMGRASVYNDWKNYLDALSDYNTVLNLDKAYHYAYKARGMVKFNDKKFAAAAEDFTRYIIFEETDPTGYYYRGLSRIANSELLDGCMDLSKASDMGYDAATKAIKKSCE